MNVLSLTQLRERAGNLWALTLGEGIRPVERTPHVVVADGDHRTLRRFASDSDRGAAAVAGAAPVLLVPPIAAPATCYDLSPETSVVAHLASTARVPYVIDFGEMGYGDRGLGFEDFALDIIPQAIARTLEDFWDGEVPDGAGVDLYGWSLGGTLSFLTAGASTDSIRSIVSIATPLKYAAQPPYPLVTKLAKPVRGMGPGALIALMGGIPAPIVQVAYRATSWDRELKKPKFVLENLGEPEKLARMEVIDRFQRTFPGYPGKLATQLWERLIFRGELAAGHVQLGERTIDLHSIDVPIQLFGSHRDALCAWETARHGVDLFTGSPRVEFATVESSHLGLVAGPDAVRETWPVIDAFLASVDAGSEVADPAR
ncbi:alpha/beta hydrolase [Tsukamurella paurometabola]|uniref:Acyl-CoA synthetase n=1 Tax=Tsukamurella paurometabola TaxID=2061 RepID=A0A3P8K6I1_TSUPA|nr:alpha/beta hydrolase [Tsukamurella paurometabola]MBS4103716.1 alpha/beta hydrolase [Tsukamurella paurometabola]UEA83282.1 alpha/beta hydrolase [Tsukamurella paurometabola]VDR40384.1 acyl-CoA synthetase [Tsukamurella paurometabola]